MEPLGKTILKFHVVSGRAEPREIAERVHPRYRRRRAFDVHLKELGRSRERLRTGK